MKIRVVIPCFNEGEVITQTHQQLTEILSQDSSVKGYDYNMLFIDDGSVNSGLKMLFYGGLKMSFFSGLRL
ncbi:glycosyltransferase, partial [Staphylococcus aureus]|uniref:glycosyltransferase n=1 Tax=Staphylococcus aureus TaxID=1280 RepID=UPI000AD6F400